MTAINRSVPPVSAGLPALHPPHFEQFVLENGLLVVLLRDARFPSVSFRLGMPGGNKVDPRHRTGIAETLCDMLVDGTAARDARALAEEVALLGANIHFSATDDFFAGSGNVLAENLGEALSLFAEALLESVYPSHELALRKQNRLQELMVERSEAGYWADSFLHKHIFGDHPYATTSPEPEHVIAIEREDLTQVWSERISPARGVFVLVGDLPETARVRELLEARFGGWRNGDALPLEAQMVEVPRPAVMVIHRPGSVQAEVRLGRNAIPRKHPDYFPLMMMNTVLGGGASSRLFMEIREKQGLAYHVSSSLTAMVEHGMMSLTTQVSPEKVGDAIRGLHHEMRRLAEEPVPDAELASVRNYLSGTFVLRLESHSSLAGQLSGIKLLDLGDDFLHTYVARVAATTGQQIQDAAARYLRPEDYTLVVAGDAEVLPAQVEDFGEVRIVNAG